MRYVLIGSLIFLLLNNSLLAQDTPIGEQVVPPSELTSLLQDIRLQELDFSDAQVSLAGPAAIYLRNVKKNNENYSLLFKKDNEESWILLEVTQEGENVFPKNSVFEFARLTSLSDGQLELDGILVDGKPYRTIVSFTGDRALKINPVLEAGTLIGSSLRRARQAGSEAYKDEIARLEASETDLSDLRRINQETLAKIGSLETEKERAAYERGDLLNKVGELNQRNQVLVQELDGLKGEFESMRQAKLELEQIILANTTTQTTLETAHVVQRDARVQSEGASDDQGVLSRIESSIDKLQAQVLELGRRIDGTSSRLVSDSDGPQPVSAGNGTANPELEQQIKDLQKENERLMAERNTLEQSLRETLLRDGYLALLKPSLKNQILAGFDQAKSIIGRWKVSPNLAEQIDARQYFSQLKIPLEQSKKNTLYKFTLKSTGKAWVGAGLHLFSTGSSKRGYGQGRSLLVWLTRDPEHYKNNRTYLQVYKSDDDINMGRVLDAAIPEHIGEDLDIEVLYQPNQEYITIAVNGVEKVRYKTWFGVNEGVEVALRTLDTAQFSNLEVWTE